ncbi:tRNA-yW-synthesizing protein 2 [Pyronema domesticum]|nr:tRNA-yW-synthesizing protein 2 [Pyronema domesticum]
MSSSPAQVFAVVCAAENVKNLKSALSERSVFARHIEKVGGDYVLHTTVPWSNPTPATDAPDSSTSTTKELPKDLQDLPAPHSITSRKAAATKQQNAPANPLTAFLTRFLTLHPSPNDLATLLKTAPKRCDIYPPLLLLAASAFSEPEWKRYIGTHELFLPELAAALGVSHIARNAPIHASTVMRSPSGLEFLYPAGYRSPDSFDSALWVTTTQNGIRQTWAPEHTMFSRGNVKEKARVLNFPGIKGQEVVDLYAGIGYFVFSYVKAGAKRVYGWEINPWSVEALRRGAEMNGWKVRVVKAGEHWEEVQNGDDVKVVVFEESNEEAVGRLGDKKVGHVNMGLLPTSKGAYEAATRLLEEGGFAHVHENIAEDQVEEMKGTIAGEFGKISGRRFECGHVEKVKTFAPEVWHCVYDVQAVGDGSG